MRMVLTILCMGLLVCFSSNVFAGSSISGAKNGVAIQGYDPVAYFSQNTAVRGSATHSYEWAGTTWFFSSADHRDLFAAEPAKYAPQYGGHCSLSVAKGKTGQGSAEAWTVYRKKLYLNASKEVEKRWEQDMSGNIFRADREWPQLKAQLEAE